MYLLTQYDYTSPIHLGQPEQLFCDGVYFLYSKLFITKGEAKMASIVKRGNSYRISVSLGYDSKGKKITKTTTYKPKATAPTKIEKEVAAYALKFEESIKSGDYSESSEIITFEKFVERWKTDYAEANISPGVLRSYIKILELYAYPNIGRLKLNAINPLHLNKIYKSMNDSGKSIGTIRKVHAVISSVLTRAYKWGLIKENVCNRVELPKQNKTAQMNCFTVEQANIFLNEALNKEYSFTYSAHSRTTSKGKNYQVGNYIAKHAVPYQFKVLFNIAVLGGLRRGELISLTWNDIDFSLNEIHISKSTYSLAGTGQHIKAPKTYAGYRNISLPKNCMSMIADLKKKQMEYSLKLGTAWEGYQGKEYDKNFLFITEFGSQMNLSTPTHKFKEILENWNKEAPDEKKLPIIRLHDLRHTSASLLISSNVDIRTVAHRLGHSKTSVTLDIYSHAFKSSDEKAANTLAAMLK